MYLILAWFVSVARNFAMADLYLFIKKYLFSIIAQEMTEKNKSSERIPFVKRVEPSISLYAVSSRELFNEKNPLRKVTCINLIKCNINNIERDSNKSLNPTFKYVFYIYYPIFFFVF